MATPVARRSLARRVAAASALGGLLLAMACRLAPATDDERLAMGKAMLKGAVERIAAAPSVTVHVRQQITRDGARGARTTQAVTNVVRLRRPDRIRVVTTGQVVRDFWYDGTTATLALHGEKVFAQAPMPDTTDAALEAITTRYDVPLPMADLLYSDAPATLDAAATSGGFVGRETVNGRTAAHLTFATGKTTWQVWVSEGADPVILQAHVEYGGRRSRPTHHMVFDRWSFGDAHPDDVFVAQVGEDYEGVAMLQRAAAVRASLAATGTPSSPPAAARETGAAGPEPAQAGPR